MPPKKGPPYKPSLPALYETNFVELKAPMPRAGSGIEDVSLPDLRIAAVQLFNLPEWQVKAATRRDLIELFAERPDLAAAAAWSFAPQAPALLKAAFKPREPGSFLVPRRRY